jgi:3-methyladenine DNA glycosylase AlkC
MDALKYFTPFGSSEFAVREFLRIDMERALAIMEVWANPISRERLAGGHSLDHSSHC